ncbi:MAG: LysM peptidoglycan-binding domain-containing protein, partial [bacterium]|nr:LysM peptidoglycan-binding domain-containing protein [bacterium]
MTAKQWNFALLGMIGTFCCLVFPMPLDATTPEPGSEPEVPEWHVVTPADSLWSLAERYLHDPNRWVEIWQLNPDIVDPDFLLPGQRVRLPGTAPEPPPPEPPPPEPPPPEPSPERPLAVVSRLAERVEEQLLPDPWRASGVGNPLESGHAMRTFERSSAELAFLDGANLRITEESLVFLRDRKVRRFEHGGAIEIVDGQADVETPSTPASPLDVELQLGETLARPDTESGTPSYVRARRTDDGSAQLMAFAGSMRVESAGTEVVLVAGTGTVVTEEAAPTPPETLPPPPEVTTPETARFAPTDVELSWNEVDGAVAYVVEVCRDPGCGSLVRRATVSATRWTPPLEPGRYSWRVNGVAASGLDGPPSAPATITVAADEPPPPAGISASL